MHKKNLQIYTNVCLWYIFTCSAGCLLLFRNIYLSDTFFLLILFMDLTFDLTATLVSYSSRTPLFGALCHQWRRGRTRALIGDVGQSRQAIG